MFLKVSFYIPPIFTNCLKYLGSIFYFFLQLSLVVKFKFLFKVTIEWSKKTFLQEQLLYDYVCANHDLRCLLYTDN